MVDVSTKPPSHRHAIASGRISLTPEAYVLVKDLQKSRKGSVLAVAQLAGIMAAKQTSNLIPLCHSLPLTHAGVEFELNDATSVVDVQATVSCYGRTGVEMEALCAVSVALLTIYDMTKAVSHDHVISEVKLVEKDGGRSGRFRRH